MAGERCRIRGDFRRRAGRHQVSAGISRAGPEIDDVVRATDRLFVVLDHEHRIAQVAQRFERVQQAIVVARVQADGRLVEHIQHAAQPRTDLRRQANALGFAARKRGGRAVEGEIAEPDGEQKIEPFGDFGERAPGDLALPQSELRAHFVHGRARCVSGSAVNSAIERPAIFTARLSGRSRRSLHAAQGAGDIYCVSHSR